MITTFTNTLALSNVDTLALSNVDREHVRFQPPICGDPEPRRLRMEKKDVMKYGGSPDCPACRAIVAGKAWRAAHSTSCRERIEGLMAKDPEDMHRVVYRAAHSTSIRAKKALDKAAKAAKAVNKSVNAVKKSVKADKHTCPSCEFWRTSCEFWRRAHQNLSEGGLTTPILSPFPDGADNGDDSSESETYRCAWVPSARCQSVQRQHS